jgi:hypothetical protein
MKERAVGFVEVSVAGDTLKLPPRLATGMTIGPNVAAPEPTVIGAIRIGTEVSVCVDGASASSREGDHGRW